MARSNRCTFCGDPMSCLTNQQGEIQGARQIVRCCHNCAVEALPKLTALALHIPDQPSGFDVPESALALFAGRFHRALDKRLSNRSGAR